MKLSDADLSKRLEICAHRAGGKKTLASVCEISLPQLFRYIKGTATLPTYKLVAVAKASNVHPYWLLTGEGAPDVRPIQSFISVEQMLQIDAKSLTDSLLMAEQIDREYGFNMTPKSKADFVFALYTGVYYESKLLAKPYKFESSKALEIYGYLNSIQGEMPRKMLLNTIEIIRQASSNLLSDKEVRTFCNYLNTANKERYNHPTLVQPYFDRIGYRLEPDTVTYVDELVQEVKRDHALREEHIKVLDLGCGNGRHLLHFAKDKRLQVIGIDNNCRAKAICNGYEAAGKIPENSFFEGDIYELPFKDGSFDMVFSNASIFYSPFLIDSPYGLNQVMQEIQRVLKPKGVVYIHSRYGIGFEPFPFFQLHNEGSIRQVAQKHNFQMKWFKTFFWNDSIEYIPNAGFNDWFSTLLVKS